MTFKPIRMWPDYCRDILGHKSRSTFYEWKKRGIGPKTARLGSVEFTTFEWHLEWLEAMANRERDQEAA